MSGDASASHHFGPRFGVAGVSGGSHDLGPQLEPALKQACNGRLSSVRWFRADWQRGGAATGYAQLAPAANDPPGTPTPEVVVKLPIGPREYRFLTSLAQTSAPTPRVVFHGMELGGWDLAWVVMERLPGNPLAGHLHKEIFERLCAAATRFYEHATQVLPLEPPENGFNWPVLLEKARENVRANHPTREQAWANGLKHVHKVLPRVLGIWESRAINTWCHGDLHPGNAMNRAAGSPWGDEGTVLLDFAEVHPGHWVEDGVYLERIYWGRPEALDGVKPVSLLAKARRAKGLDTSDDYAMLANVRRLLMAATAPAFMHRDGHPKYLQAAEDVMERMLVAIKG